MSLSVINKPEKGTIPLAGNWKYCAEKKLPRLGIGKTSIHGKVKLRLTETTPTHIYNAMLHPLIKFPIKGAIWYQGESNAADPAAYAQLQPLLIADWRSKWGLGDFPFYFVQLAGFTNAPGTDEWPRLRQAQLETLAVPNTGMAVTIDIGEPLNIHPANKQDVGKRLARQALAKTYKKTMVPCGPLLQQAVAKGGKVVLRFDHVGEGLKTLHHPRVYGFELADQSGNFVPAQAKIAGQTVIVFSLVLAKPTAVRYGWEKFPRCNLYNSENLPAAPFTVQC